MRAFAVMVLASLAWSGCHASATKPPQATQEEAAALESGIVCSSGETPKALRRVIVRGAGDRSPCAVIRSIAGRPETARVVESDIQALFATGVYDDIVAVREHDEHGIELVFELKERPPIASVSLDGLGSEAAKTALAGFELETPERVDPAWLRSAERRLAEELVDAGFSRATVQAAVQHPSDTRSASVRFVIDEGPQTLLTRLSIAGLRVANEKTVREALRLRAGAPAPPELIARDEMALNGVLLDVGLLSAQVEKQVVGSDDGTGLEVSFQVKEGPVSRLRKIAVTGDAQLEAKQYAPLLGRLKPGAVFSRSTVRDIQTKMEALHATANATTRVGVEPKIDFIPGSTDVNVSFDVSVR